MLHLISSYTAVQTYYHLSSVVRVNVNVVNARFAHIPLWGKKIVLSFLMAVSTDIEIDLLMLFSTLR